MRLAAFQGLKAGFRIIAIALEFLLRAFEQIGQLLHFSGQGSGLAFETLNTRHKFGHRRVLSQDRRGKKRTGKEKGEASQHDLDRWV